MGILAGKDEFESERGAWSTLAGDALLMEDGTYVPDFTAFVRSENIRLLHLTRSSVLAAKNLSSSTLVPPQSAQRRNSYDNAAVAMGLGQMFYNPHFEEGKRDAQLTEKAESVHSDRQCVHFLSGSEQTDIYPLRSLRTVSATQPPFWLRSCALFYCFARRTFNSIFGPQFEKYGMQFLVFSGCDKTKL